MDKKVFLLDKECYNQKQVELLTEKDLEQIVSRADYEYNYSIVKIDTNEYDRLEDIPELEDFDLDDYWLIPFGF